MSFDVHKFVAAEVAAHSDEQGEFLAAGIDIEDHRALHALERGVELYLSFGVAGIGAGYIVVKRYVGVGVEAEAGHDAYACAKLHKVGDGGTHFKADTIGRGAETHAEMVGYIQAVKAGYKLCLSC